MGVLAALEYAPFLLFGLLAGVSVDRLPRRPILFGADLGRALLLASVPLAAALDRLGMAQLYLVAFLAGGRVGAAQPPAAVRRAWPLSRQPRQASSISAPARW